MAWWIEEDLIDDGRAVGTWNGRFREPSLATAQHFCKEKFKLLDDDDTLYYVGYSNDSSSFDPLNEFGMPNSGCTSIEYFNSKKGKWETL